MKTNHQFPALFVLRCGDSYVGPLCPKTLQNPLVPSPAQAMRLDARDNEALKAKFFSIMLGADVTPEAI